MKSSLCGASCRAAAVKTRCSTTRSPAVVTPAASQHFVGPTRRRASTPARRSLHTSTSTTAATSPSVQARVSPRPPIPSQVVRTKPSQVSTPSAALPGDTTELDADSVDALAAEAEDEAYVSPPPLSSQSLSLLYSYTTPPPTSALSAFAARLAQSTSATSSSSSSSSLAGHLPLLEQCLIHESFWAGVRTLPPSDTRQSYTNYNDAPHEQHNGPLATLGNALLGTLTSELLFASFPSLPTRVQKAAVTMYAGPKSLAAVAASWGVCPTRFDLRTVGVDAEEGRKTSKKDRAYGHLVGGVGGANKKKDLSRTDGAAGMGLVRWNRMPTTPAKDAVLFEDALASVARAIVGAIYQIHGFAAARSFVHAHFLPRLVSPSASASPSPLATSDLVPLLKFTNPTRVLSLTMARHQARVSSTSSSSSSTPTTSRVVHRLLKESGRLSAHPTFVSGVYLDAGAGDASGSRKLGEGFGSSIKMSEWRASEDALRRWYLASPARDGNAAGAGTAVGRKGLPSDEWALSHGELGRSEDAGTATVFEGLRVGDVEVHEESRR